MFRISTLCCGVLFVASYAEAQTDQSTQAPAPAPAAEPTPFAVGPITFSGLVDAYYSLNFNHPASKNNVIRNFDVKANQFSLNMAKLSVEHTPDPVGFKLELAAGRAMDVFHATDPAGSEVVKHVFQAYVSLKPEKWKGIQLDFGKFVTSAGAEPTETHLNWNYSRSLLYANGPYYHMGARLSVPLSSYFTAGVQLVNGWNNVEDNNSGKTGGLTFGLTTSKLNIFHTYYFGNEKTDTVDGVKVDAPGMRHFWDTVVAVNPSGRISGTFNFDYGIDKNPLATDAHFYGFSAMARFAVNDMIQFSPRYDWYKDRDGFITGVAQTLQEFTFTGDVKLPKGFLMRAEYRRDWSSQPFFDHGNERANWMSQPTALVGMIAVF